MSTSVKELKVGAKAPAFKLPTDEDGQTLALKDFAGQWLVIYFYPKDATPGCTQQACDFRDVASPLKKLGAAVIGISRDSVASHGKFKAKQALNFPLLADIEGKACEAYGVWQEKTLYGRKFMGIVRTTFLIDPRGRIVKIYPKVKVADHVDTVMADLRAAIRAHS